MTDSSKRLTILSPDEIKSLFYLPKFSEEERKIYFSLDPDETLLFESLRRPNAMLLFLLQLGYFKVSHQFFVFPWEDVHDDRNYLLSRYFPGLPVPSTLPGKNTRLSHQKSILKCHSYSALTQRDHKLLCDKAQQLTKIHAQPRFILTELLRILDMERITVPGYSTLQKIIGAALHNEQQRLNAHIGNHMQEEVSAALKILLTKEDSVYLLTALKKRAKDFSLTQVKQEIQKHTSIANLYEFAHKFLPSLELSNENIRYYASLAEYYPVHRLQRMPETQALLYLICFIAYCYEQISDNLIVSFIHQVNSTTQEAALISKQLLTEYHLDHKKQLNQTGKVVQLFVDETIDDELPFKEIKQRAFDIIEGFEHQRYGNVR